MRVPYLAELDLKDRIKDPWIPTDEEKKNKQHDEEVMKAAFDYRSQFEAPMRRAAKSWNLLYADVPDKRITNVLLPFIRMICRQIVASMTEALPSYGYRPRHQDDIELVDLWKAANDHIDNQTNMAAEQEDMITNLIVLGNAGYEDFVETPYKAIRTVHPDGSWKSRTVRDRSRPRIGTRSRSPWDFAFAPWARDPNGRVPKVFKDFYSHNQFVDEICNAVVDGKWKYKNVEKVLPGYKSVFGAEGVTRYEQENHDGVMVLTLQDPITDVLRKYANGVLIYDIPLHEYILIQRPTLSIATNHHIFDSNLKTTAAWGVGEAHILRGLDAIYQAIGNLAIDNYKLANTNLISVKNGGQTTLDPDLEYVSGMRLDGDVIVSPLGTVRLADYQGFKTMIEELANFTTGFNHRQLVGDTSKTAFEYQQRLKAQLQELNHKIRKLENGFFKSHGEVRLCMMLQHMTVEEYEDVSVEEVPKIIEMLKRNKQAKQDYRFRDGLPVERVLRETIRVKGQKIEERYDGKGRRRRENLLFHGKSKGDSFIPVVPEYFQPREFMEGSSIPEVDVYGKEMNSQSQDLKFQKTQYLANYGRQRIAEAANNPQVEELQTEFDAKLIDEQVVQSVDVPRESVMHAEKDDGRLTAKDVQERVRKLKKSLTTPRNAQTDPTIPQIPATQAPVSGVRSVDAGGLGAFEGADTGSTSNTARVAERALGPA